jgi:hypothetical protein
LCPHLALGVHWVNRLLVFKLFLKMAGFSKFKMSREALLCKYCEPEAGPLDVADQ